MSLIATFSQLDDKDDIRFDGGEWERPAVLEIGTLAR